MLGTCYRGRLLRGIYPLESGCKLLLRREKKHGQRNKARVDALALARSAMDECVG
jgi:hypothetical protein